MNGAGITGYIYTFAQVRYKYDRFFTLWERESLLMGDELAWEAVDPVCLIKIERLENMRENFLQGGATAANQCEGRRKKSFEWYKHVIETNGAALK